ncbi:uncharacterized protein LOC101845155 [Aplysia californica]|uniref:Uncharacterized protein LOC101845155 n=1 Tax=Aplysia californica TaxID=6500 RepID=A0ABM0JH29_APLCA|nr:uncharacterized protein LOC101845155 [Aplysia californica]
MEGVEKYWKVHRFQMEKRRGHGPSRNRNVFKGSVLVSLLVESHPKRFPNRSVACKLARRLFKDGHITTIFGAKDFEDSAQLYVWQDDDVIRKRGRNAIASPTSSSCSNPVTYSSPNSLHHPLSPGSDLEWELIQDIRNKVLNRSEAYNIVTSYNTFFQELEQDFGYDHSRHSPRKGIAGSDVGGWTGSSGGTPHTSTLELKKKECSPYYSTDSSVEGQGQRNKRHKDKSPSKGVKKEHVHHSEVSENNPESPYSKTPFPSIVVSSPHSQKGTLTNSAHVVNSVQNCDSQDIYNTQEPLLSSNSKSTPPHIKQQLLQSQDAHFVHHRHRPHHQQKHHQQQQPYQTLSVSPQRRVGAHEAEPTSSPPHPLPPPFACSSANTGMNIHPDSNAIMVSQDSRSSSHVTGSHDRDVIMAPRGGMSDLDIAENTQNLPGGTAGSLVSSVATTESVDNNNTLTNSGNNFATVDTLHRSSNSSSHHNSHHHHQNPHHHNIPPQSQQQQQHHPQKWKREGNNTTVTPSQPHHQHLHPPPSSSSAAPQDMIANWLNADPVPPLVSSAKTGASQQPTSATRWGSRGDNNNITASNNNSDPRTAVSSVRTPHSVVSSGSPPRWPENEMSDGMDSGGRRWPPDTNAYSYSDNEKQLLEEMRRMKKEHQSVLRTYEGRVNKLMAKMHELRNIAEMLENSSSKSSPYGVLPGKLALLNILVDKDGQGKKATSVSPAECEGVQIPPPLPPRPGRGLRVYPNKPIIHTGVAMRQLSWSRIILEDAGAENSNTVWQGMTEPKIDTDELERLFSGASNVSEEVNLYDDICLRRGRSKSQTTAIYDNERSQRIISELKVLHCTLPDVVQAFVALNSDDLHTDSFAELLELLNSQRELDKILHHVKRKGASHLDVAEFLVFELSKVDHFRERLEFLRFKNKLQINLFEIDQQLKELHTACEEITTSLSLKHVLETVLAVGNHMNGGTENGQADGFKLDILNSLKDMQDQSHRGNLLELIMKIYCLKFESDTDFGCPKRFRLPEPSNMRHAAQVSFEDIQRALVELKEELTLVRNKLENLSKREGSNLTIALRVTSENFMTSAVEMLAEEQKLLEDTRGHFWKTTAFFSLDGQRTSPHDFFQIWASFLHDCKYYWKLAHRNLAKIKFNGDLATKSQLSCSSLPGFNNLKSVMMRHVASFQQDEDMRASKAQQLQHINSWIESVGRYAMEMQPEMEHQMDFPENTLSGPQASKNDHIHQSGSHYNSLSGPPPMSPNEKSNSELYKDSKHEHRHQHSEPSHPSNKHIHSNVSAFKEPNRPEVSSSPKPIKATPPNVIRPQPLLHTSPTMSSPSPTNPVIQLVQPSNLIPILREDSDDNFGFEPPYETLSKPQPPNQLSSPLREETDNAIYPSSSNTSTTAYPTLNSPVSPDVEVAQKKNANFFKTLLKRDQKRSHQAGHSEDGSPHSSSQHSSTHKSGSTPFNKLRNTFVQKLSGNAGSKKSSSTEAPSSLVPSHQGEVPPKPPKGLVPADIDQTPSQKESNKDSSSKQSSSNYEDNKTSHVNYQNYYYPGQPRRREDPVQKSGETENFSATGYSGIRDGHDSLPSTISSVHSFRDHTSQKYPLNILPSNRARDAETPERQADHVKYPKKEAGQVNDLNNNIESDQSKPSRGSRARVRAPIALGSNMSISDVYGKATEAALTDGPISNIDRREVTDVPDVYDGEGQLGDHGNNMAPRPSSSESKWVKASAVPVYKAKLIPNYENQTKLDPRIEGGVRGQAEAPAPARHAPQVSNSSDVYRQELQKKSEQFVGGGIYPTVGQLSGGKTNSIPGMPTSYTVLPPKPIHYHASPIVVSQGPHASSNPSVNNVSDSNALPSNLSDRNDTHAGEKKFSHRISSPHGEEFKSNKNGPHFVVSPDGRLQMEPTSKVTPPEQGRTPARRSASAHSVLDKDRETGSHDRMTWSAHGSPGSSQSRTHGRTSRKDNCEVKHTPTSSRDHHQQGKPQNGPPQSVGNLIDRFEKKPGSKIMPIGLLDIDDKPPSMTSTPVARRKNQGAGVDRSGNQTSSAGPSERESSKSGSTSGKSNKHGNPTSDPSSQHDFNRGLTSSHRHGGGGGGQHGSKSQSQTVAPFLVQAPSTSSSGRHGTSSQQPQHQAQSYTTDSYSTGGSHSRHRHHGQNFQSPDFFQQTHHHQQQLQQGIPQDHIINAGNLEHHRHHRDSGDKKSGKSSQIGSYTASPGTSNLSHTPSDRVPTEHSRSSSSKKSPHTQSSQGKMTSSQGHTPSNISRNSSQGHTPSSQGHHRSSKASMLSSPPVSSSTSSHVSNYQSPFLPKPEPQYPSHQQDQQRNYDQPSSSQQPQQQQSTSQSSSTSNRPEQDQYNHQGPPSQGLLNMATVSPQSQQTQSSTTAHSSFNNPQSHQQQQQQQHNFQTHNSPPQNFSSHPSTSPSSSSQYHHHHQFYNPQIVSSNTANSMTNAPNITSSNFDSHKYSEELRRASKSTNSAFERPLKSNLSYGRQPGAMAVVKPTVMHL